MPNRVRITTSCCQINCGGQGDIAINVQYSKPPKINHDLVVNVCERPAVIGGDPPGHGQRQALAGGRREEVHLLRGLLSALSADADQRSGFDQAGDLGRRQALQRAQQADLPQAGDGPRWPEVAEAVKTILYAYKENARDWERMGEWIDRIGWPRFFELTDLPFTKHHIDDWRGARSSLNASSHVYL
jgi:sulfite reductase beta subunit